MTADGWTVLLQWQGNGKAVGAIERRAGFALVHFDLPSRPLGDYHISVQQPFLDIHRSWAGTVDCWRGSELTSIALNYEFTTCANRSLPVICNYDRAGENRGVIGMLDPVPLTQVKQRPLIEEPPMRLLQTRFSRARKHGGFRETVVICRAKVHFVEAIRRFMRFCRDRNGIQPLPAPDWAREPVWCSWYSHLYRLKQRDIEAQIPHLEKLGLRTVVIDASWFQSRDYDVGCERESGEYRMNPEFFPDFPGLSRRLREAGLRLMLWVAPAFIGRESRARRSMARWCVWDGRERTTHLCPFCEESRAHARRTAERVMRDYQLDGLKCDFLDLIAPQCSEPAHDHGDGNFGAAMIEFLRAVHDGALAANPGAAIEYRISYSTLATLPFANCHRGNDSPYDADYMRRENLFLRLFCEHPSAVWSDYAYWRPDESVRNISLMLGSQIFSGGVPTLSLDFTKCGEAQRRTIGRWLRFYRRHRDALAQAELVVHSADSVFSVSSLQNAERGVAFVLLAGQHVPARLSLGPRIREVWMLNASAEQTGILSLVGAGRPIYVHVAGLGPVHVRR
jgi:alpha-galactosidase